MKMFLKLILFMSIIYSVNVNPFQKKMAIAVSLMTLTYFIKFKLFSIPAKPIDQLPKQRNFERPLHVSYSKNKK